MPPVPSSAARGAIVQGRFVGGRPRIPVVAAPSASIQPRRAQPNVAQPRHVRPQAVQPQAVQPRSTAPQGPVVQRLGNGEAFQLPAHLSNFGGGSGQPLPNPVRQKMESFFNTSFADVRVHVGTQASSIGAQAFTRGSNLYFAHGQYNPNTVQGQQLLGHELTHVVQQRAGRVRNPFGSGIAVVQDRNLEAEADRMGLRAAMQTVSVQARLSSGVGGAHSHPATTHAARSPFNTPFPGQKSISPVLARCNSPAVQRCLGDKDEITSENRGFISAYRVEGKPKSPKQKADLLKHTPSYAINESLSKVQDLGEQLRSTLTEHWTVIAAAKNEKAREKLLLKVKKDNKLRKRRADSLKIVKNAIELMDELNTNLLEGKVMGSRLQINGSHYIPYKDSTGKVTAITGPFNFSVGRQDHARYFAKGFDNSILIEFYLDKKAWRKWKIEKSGPQKKTLGPSPGSVLTTINDVTQPGVKYEVSAAAALAFYKEVIAKDKPAKITIFDKSKSASHFESDLKDAAKRLQKVYEKLLKELRQYDPEETEAFAERKQLSVSEKVLTTVTKENLNWKKQSEDTRKELYSALSLTKNALHSVRRKFEK